MGNLKANKQTKWTKCHKFQRVQEDLGVGVLN